MAFVSITQFLSLILFHFYFQSFSKPLCPLDQTHALLQFKSSFSINSSASIDIPNPYPKTDSWTEGTDCCLWDGVSCDLDTGFVIGLHLRSSMLYGNFYPNNSLFALRHLQKLDLSDNDFNGSKIPSEFGNLLRLTHLNLNFSLFQGRIPLEMGHLFNLVSLDLSENPGLIVEETSHAFNKLARNLTKLQKLDLSFVNLSSISPNSFINLSSSLSSLKLSQCELGGKFPKFNHLFSLVSLDLSRNSGLIVEETSHAFNKLVRNLSKLQELDLSTVDLSSISPNSFINLSSSLSILRLPGCELGGNFPGNIIQLPNLQDLHLGFNYNLSGSLPKSNWSLSLYSLSLSRTKIPIYLENHFFENLKFLQKLSLIGCNFKGYNIGLFGNLSKLIWLDLSDNNFGCPIPSSFGNLVQLQYLILSNSSLSSPIPSSFANLKQLYYLDIANNKINGPIPNFFTKFTQLQYLYLSNNQFSSHIPSNVGWLSSLRSLQLQKNQLSGQIPSDIGRLSSLIFLDLSHNKLYGSTPRSIFKLVNLSVLILSSNDKLSGEIPSEVCELKYLEILDLSNNNFSGLIPHCLGNLSIKLLVLHLGMNKFNGVIPNNFAKNCSMRYLNFNHNTLQGKIPPSISNCKDLEILDLSNNEIDDTFPSFLQTLEQLQILQLRWNKLHGLVNGCNSFSNYSFSKLRIFDLSNNLFSGPLPVEYFNKFKAMINLDQNMTYMRSKNYTYDYSVSLTWKGLEIELVKIQTILTSVDLSGNSFKGKIPKLIGMFKSLKQLLLSHNNLIGHIEPTLGNLANLETLDLSSNCFNGHIPMELANLTSLAVFNVSYNQLEGPIPIGKQFNTFENSAYVGNEGLCGFPLTKPCNFEELTPTGDRDSEYDENGFGWKSILIGYAFGAVFGVVMEYVVFKTRKPAWLVKLIEGEGRRRPRRSNGNHRLSGTRRRN